MRARVVPHPSDGFRYFCVRLRRLSMPIYILALAPLLLFFLIALCVSLGLWHLGQVAERVLGWLGVDTWYLD